MNILKSPFLFLYRHLYQFLLFIFRHPISTLIALACVLVTYSPYAFAVDYYIDSEVVINIPETTYNWLEIGRYGLVFSRLLLGTSLYNPYYTGILLLFFLWLTVMTLSYLTHKLFPAFSILFITLGSLLFITYPTFSEQYYFHYQSAEVAFGLWLSVVAAGLFFSYVKSGRWMEFFLSIPIYVLTFSIYQSFIPLALCFYLGIFLVHITQTDVHPNGIKRGIIGSVLHFLLAFFISQGINRILFASSDYLDDQIIWSYAASVWEALRAVISTCIKMFIGQGMFYTSVLLLAVFGAGIVFAVSYFSKKKEKAAHPFYPFLIFCTIIGIVITPFLLTMLMGPSTAARTQFTYPLAALFLLYYTITYLSGYLRQNSITRIVFSLILLAFVSYQVYSVRLIWNAHSYIAEHDRSLSTRIMEELYNSHMICDGVGTILWGNIQPESPYDDILSHTPSTMFFSVFNLEHDMIPLCYFSTIRVLGYMESMGHPFPLPTYSTQFVAEYQMDRDGLAVYPENGCIMENPEAFVLNLGQVSE